MNYEALISNSYRQLQPYKAGLTSEKIQEKYNLDLVFKYASNESPFPPSPKACEAMVAAMTLSNRYPDYDKLKAAISNDFDLQSTYVMLGTGSINVLDILFQLLNRPGSNVVFSSHSYFAYSLLAQKVGLEIKLAECDDSFGHVAEHLVQQCDNRTSLLVIDNPTNFSGTALNGDQLQWILSQVSQETIVILDQAYAEFSDTPFIDINRQLFEKYPNLLITRTFSKVYSLASLRVGYAFAHPDLVSWFSRGQQPFPISNIANAAAMASLNDKNYYQKNLKEVKDGRAWLTARLNNLGIKTTNSQANFVTAHLGQNAGELYTALLENGFITRQMTVYKAPEYLRFSVGTADENQRLIAEIEARKTLWDVAV